MTDELTPAEEDAALAAEYTLGLLTRAESDALEQRLSVDPAFRAHYARWAAHFTSLMENVAPVAPPARVRTAIVAQLFPTQPRSLWARIGIIPALVGAVLTVVVVLGLVNLDALTRLVAPQGPVYTATIAAEDQSLVILASYDASAGALTLERTTGAATSGRSQEVWLIIPGVEAPVSLGLMSDDAVTTITPPEALADAINGATLAITDEPPGGSPIDGPTGAVLAAGAVGEA